MRAAVLTAVVTLALAFPVRAEPPEQRYFAARDAAIAKVTAAMEAYAAMAVEPPSGAPAVAPPAAVKAAAPAWGKAAMQQKAKAIALAKAKAAAQDKAKAAALEKVTALEKAEHAKLEADMREMVGPISIAGFDKEGKLNLGGLIKGDQGFGALDGLVFTSADNKASVIVTTTGAFRRWLAEHKNWWGPSGDSIPQQPGVAVQQNAFYTQALMSDAAIVGLTDLHVRKPLGSVFVYALLGARTQDALPREANEVFIAVGRRGNVFIGRARIEPVGPIPRCDATWKAAAAPQDDDKARKKAETRFLKCFGSWARYQPRYGDALSAAQQIIYAVAAQ
jgi:hypothetical protein